MVVQQGIHRYPPMERVIYGMPLTEALAQEVVAFVQRLRTADLTKAPGVAETLDWSAALLALGARRLEAEQVEQTLGVLLKYQEDVGMMRNGGARTILDESRVGGRR